MKKVRKIIFSFLVLTPFIVLSFWIYASIPTTPSLIVTLIILMVGVTLAYFVFSKRDSMPSDTLNTISTIHFPPIESDTLPVSPSLFCDKFEKKQGDFYLITFDEAYRDIALVDCKYDKLRDVLTLKFTKGIRAEIKGVSTIKVGNVQIMIDSFSELTLYKDRKKTSFHLERSKLTKLSEGHKTLLKTSRSMPSLIFEWGKV